MSSRGGRRGAGEKGGVRGRGSGDREKVSQSSHRTKGVIREVRKDNRVYPISELDSFGGAYGENGPLGKKAEISCKDNRGGRGW